MAKILIIDDEIGILKSMTRILMSSDGVSEKDIVACNDGKLAEELLEDTIFDIVFSDIRMPKISGKDIFDKVRAKSPVSFIVMMTGFGDVKDAVNFIKDGAYDYITKPFEPNQIESLMKHMLKEMELKSQIFDLQRQLGNIPYDKPFIYSSEKMTEIHELIQNIRNSDFNVLLLGETGVGKEVIADAIHNSSVRSKGPMVKVNCAALVDTLLESEIFGHEKGAFTGAVQMKKGKFEMAHKGTIFLDEIGDMNYQLQAKFLRVLQDGKFERVGGSKEIEVDCRVIAATSHDLEGEIKIGRFRSDLFYRLNVVNIKIPPLRHRREEIPELSLLFLDQLNKDYSKKISGISEDFFKILSEYDFPGNIRELQNIITRAFASCSGDSLTLNDLPTEIRSGSQVFSEEEGHSDFDMKQAIENVEKEMICKALKESQGKKNHAADLLNISRRMLYYKIGKYSIPAD